MKSTLSSAGVCHRIQTRRWPHVLTALTGGLAGCVVAGRLAEADPSLSVLLIEGGENNANLDIVKHPALFPMHLMPQSKTVIWYRAKASEALNGREYPVATGGLLGGGSSANIMLYARGRTFTISSLSLISDKVLESAGSRL